MKNLVLLPGWTRNGSSYEKLWKSAPSDIRIYIPSYDYLAPSRGLAYFESQLSNYLDCNNLRKANLAGHSLGGTLAAYYAYKHPERLENLYLVDSEIFQARFLNRASRFFKEHLRRSLGSNFKAFIGVVKNPITNLGTAIVACSLNLENEVKDIKVPTFLVWGTKDIITPINEAERIQKLIENSKVIILKDADHDWILYTPEYLWKNIVF